MPSAPGSTYRAHGGSSGVPMPGHFVEQTPASGSADPIPPMPKRPPPVPVVITPPRFGEWFVIWQFDSGDGAWCDYEPSFMQLLEDHLQQHSETPLVHVPRGNAVFHYSTQEMWQQNMRSSGKRMMRRVLMTPEDWQRQDELRAQVDTHNRAHHQPRRGLPARPDRSRSASQASHPRSHTPGPRGGR